MTEHIRHNNRHIVTGHHGFTIISLYPVIPARAGLRAEES